MEVDEPFNARAKIVAYGRAQHELQQRIKLRLGGPTVVLRHTGWPLPILRFARNVSSFMSWDGGMQMPSRDFEDIHFGGELQPD